MTTFCLMHSSGQGPEGWKLLVYELEQRGHVTLTPAFDIERTDEGAVFHAATIVEALKQSGHKPAETVCVAHSASGMYLPLIAERWLPHQMVFLAAVIPLPGISILEQLNSDPPLLNPKWIGQNPMSDEVALEFVFHDCPPDRLEWALSTRIYFLAKRAMAEPCPLKSWPEVPAAYIACADDRTVTPAWQMKAARERLGVEPIVLPGGHCPNVSRPEALADVLEKLAG